jgi:hypothetical protein
VQPIRLHFLGVSFYDLLIHKQQVMGTQVVETEKITVSKPPLASASDVSFVEKSVLLYKEPAPQCQQCTGIEKK